MPPLVSELVVDGFRSIGHSRVMLEPLCALVGEPETGKSNLLAALRVVLDPSVSAQPGDQLRGGSGEIGVAARLVHGGLVRLDGTPPDMLRSAESPPPPVLYLPAAMRAGALVAADASPAPDIFRAMAADAALTQPAIIAALDACCDAGVTGALLLAEEPDALRRADLRGRKYRLQPSRRHELYLS